MIPTYIAMLHGFYFYAHIPDQQPAISSIKCHPRLPQALEMASALPSVPQASLVARAAVCNR